MKIAILNFDPEPFLKGIKERRPNVTDPDVLEALGSAEKFLKMFGESFPPGVPLARVPEEALSLLDQFIESLRCCGVAPEPWQTLPAEDAVLVPRWFRTGGPSHEAN